jgi:hypothetical protein
MEYSHLQTERLEAKMTVCIAAIADGGKTLVLASDREVTNNSVRFELQEPKVEEVAGSYFMPAGSAAHAFELTQAVRAKFGKERKTTKEAADELVSVYLQAHALRAERTVLRPRGFDFASLRMVPAAMIDTEVHKLIDMNLMAFRWTDLGFLVCGVDSGGAHVFHVSYGGQGGEWIQWLDRIGYGAIGSGQALALMSLGFSQQYPGRQLNETLFAVMSAKRAAERAPGVGPATDMLIVDDGGAREVSPETIDALSKLYLSKMASHQVTEEELDAVLSSNPTTSSTDHI